MKKCSRSGYYKRECIMLGNKSSILPLDPLEANSLEELKEELGNYKEITTDEEYEEIMEKKFQQELDKLNRGNK